MIPEVGKEYYFFDDGKTSPSRCYKAKVTRVVPREEEILVDRYDYDLDQLIPTPIQTIHKEEVDSHRQLRTLNGENTTPGAPWLYSEDTDFFVECLIPGYDKHPIWFARTVRRGWFSINIQNSWQSGELDVSGEIYQGAKEFFDGGYWYSWYDEELRKKGELI